MRSSPHTALPHASAGGGVWYVASFRLMAGSNFNIQPLMFFSISSFHHVNVCGRITFFSSLGMLCAAFVSIFFKHVAASSNHTGQIKTSHSPSSITLISRCAPRFTSTYIRTLCLSSVCRDGQSPSHSGHGAGWSYRAPESKRQLEVFAGIWGNHQLLYYFLQGKKAVFVLNLFDSKATHYQRHYFWYFLL